MRDTATLQGLRARVEGATGSDRRLDAEIACAFIFRDLRPAEPDDFDGKYGYQPGNIKCKTGFLMSDSFTRSLDAAIALVERVLPGWTWRIGNLVDGRGICRLGATTGHDAATPPLAILKALLSALISREATDA